MSIVASFGSGEELGFREIKSRLAKIMASKLNRTSLGVSPDSELLSKIRPGSALLR